MFKKMLVALDGSEASNRALEAAASLAKSQNAELTLLHVLLRNTPLDVLYDIVKSNDLPATVNAALDKIEVYPSQTGYGVAGTTPYVVVPEEALGHLAETYLDRAEKTAKDEGVVAVKKVIVDGQPAHEVLAQIKKANADLVILGSRGLGDIKSVFLGSVSHKVVQESPAPCLIVK